MKAEDCTDLPDFIRLAEERARRLQMIVEGYEVYEDGMPDSSVPGAAKIVTSHEGRIVRQHPRYVLVTQYGDRGNYRLRLGEDLRNVEQLAADAVTDDCGSEQPICYFDLDVLAGEAPDPVTVMYDGREWEIEEVRGDRLDIIGDSGALSILREEAAVIEVEEDERMPVRYGLAKIVMQVVFNTIPTEK